MRSDLLRIALLGFATVLFSGCSFLNVFKGSEDRYRNYMASAIKDTIDSDIRKEVQRGAPNGYPDYSGELERVLELAV